jgi:hypothetical protein
LSLFAVGLGSSVDFAQGRREPDWARLQDETMQHYQAILRMDTSDPPGNERPAAECLEQVLKREGIPVQLFEAEPNRVNLVARLKGNGRKRPLLIMGHTVDNSQRCCSIQARSLGRRLLKRGQCGACRGRRTGIL